VPLQLTSLSWTAEYDSRNRLVGFSRTGDAASWRYDPNGNRLAARSERTGLVDLTPEFTTSDSATLVAQSPVIEPASNRLTGLSQTVTTTRAGSILTQASSQARYTLDPAGSLLDDGLTRYDYDAANRLSQARVLYQGQPALVGYQHNALGQRVFTTEPRAEAAASTQSAPASEGFIAWLTRMLATLTRQNEPGIPAVLGIAHTYGDGPLPPWALLGDYDNGTAAGGGSTEYIWLPTEDGSAIPIGMVRNGSVLAIHTDHLGTPRLMTDGQAKPVWQWPYSGFGEIEPTGVLQPQAVAATNSRNNSGRMAAALKATAPQQRLDLRFPGQVRDALVGLNHNFLREYGKDGRYTQADSIGMRGGWNRFGYTGANALNSTDPTGQFVLAIPLVPLVITGTDVLIGAGLGVLGYGLDRMLNRQHTPDQQALGDLVRDVTNGGRKPLSNGDADTVLDWSKEVGLPVRDDRNSSHWVGGPHIHVPGSGIGHIPVQRCGR
jgi:RHS repeat-associated protein